MLPILAVVSVVLAVAVALSMVKSFWMANAMILSVDEDLSLALCDVNGRLLMVHLDTGLLGTRVITYRPSDLVPELRQDGFLGFNVSAAAGLRFISVPHLFLLPFLAIAPYLWWRRRRQFEPGHCPTCGYDVRANPERCSECGYVIAATSA